MILTETTTIPASALPLAALKDQLRLGTGFADDGLQDALVESHLRAAIAAIEGRTGKALVERGFLLRLDDWRFAAAQPLPVAPVAAITSVTLRDRLGAATTADATRWRLVPDAHRPRLAATGAALPAVPEGGWIEVAFDAGFGAAWGSVPPDLSQAVLLLAAEFYERRSEAGLRTAGLPFGVVSLIERWRTVRTFGGGAA